MTSLQPEYRRRRQQLRDEVQCGILILFKGSEHFNENLFYFTGLETFYTCAVISLEDDFECVFTNPIEFPHIGDVPQLDNIRSVSPDSLLSEVLSQIESLKPSTLYCEIDFHSKTPLPSSIFTALAATFPNIPILNVPSSITKMRLKKDAYELAIMHRGIATINQVFETLDGMVAPGISEMELSAEIHCQLVLGGFNKFYDICVASGPRSAIPYYRANNRILPNSGVIMIDIAAAVDNYVCDMTRTFSIGGKFNPQEQKIFNIVLATQQHVLSKVKPGKTLGELNEIAFDIFMQQGLEQYYYNKIGHFLGLGVDDQGADDVVLESGMVITVEPGLYLPQNGFGIRVEDMVVV